MTHDLAQALAAEYAAVPQVLAVVQGGSVTAGNADEHSDIDLYIYSRV
ncbi:nucleotidyltransferase domain-containing protein [Deinococcus alpinitundrae]|nr:nucleotidyltransferase domain-containing protein [Deinococcus alpinitundrae]